MTIKARVWEYPKTSISRGLVKQIVNQDTMLQKQTAVVLFLRHVVKWKRKEDT